MKKIFALLAATVVMTSASFAQTGTDTTMHHSKNHKSMHKSKTMKGDSSMNNSSNTSGSSNSSKTHHKKPM